MPFGLKCASNSFIRAVQQVLQPMQKFCDSYVDDLATFSGHWGAHLRACTTVLVNHARCRFDTKTREVRLCKVPGHICRPYHWIREAWCWSKQGSLCGVHETSSHEKRSETTACFFRIFELMLKILQVSLSPSLSLPRRGCQIRLCGQPHIRQPLMQWRKACVKPQSCISLNMGEAALARLNKHLLIVDI